MRTKTLLLTAAAVVAGFLSASAQVYSVNVVGYANVALPEGFSLVANPLDTGGSAVVDNVTNVFASNLPVNSKVYTWNGVGYNISIYGKNKAGTATNWSPVINVDPGLGAWVSIPAGSGTITNTFVGEVLQGALSNPNIPALGGYALLGSQVPQAGGITTALAYQPSLNDKVYKYNGAGYDIFIYAKNKAGNATNWTPSEPSIGVAQGFWLSTSAGSTWIRNFTVQ